MSAKEMNIVASVLARLRNHSKSNGAPFQQVLQQYAMERFLYRISNSKHAQSVILKGALLLKTVGIPRARPTMDIDMLRKGKADQTSLLALVKDCATLEVEADGLTFVADSAVAEEITKDSERTRRSGAKRRIRGVAANNPTLSATSFRCQSMT
ncbi:MAG TPA: nucleotidyl transferase AbiEii/AbiGii toxin family protein [Gemmatimonadaceae bacterium]|nr:nucleotidyl transferase AbiEii/AbiGii toxin family protein [Gemmatimonadaceae bacterium]